jgi:hypothetical protein
MRKVFLVLAVGLILCLPIRGISSQDRIKPLSLDEDRSTVENLTTRETWSYREFVSLTQSEPVVFNAGNYLRFKFRFRNEQHMASIPSSYRLHLFAGLSNPCWEYDYPSAEEIPKHHDNTWDVWDKFDDHRLESFEVILTGIVPAPLNEKFHEPGFGEEFELSGIARKPVRITAVLLDGRDVVQDFTGDFVFYSTTQTLEDTIGKIENFLNQSKDLDSILNSGFMNSNFSFESLRENIRKLSEEGGRPGWARILAEDIYNVYEENIDAEPFPPPTPPLPDDESPWGLILLFATVFAVVGLAVGYMLKRPYVPYRELDDATQMIEDIKSKIQVLSYSVEEPELQTKISDLGSEDLSYLKNKMSMIEYLITRKEPETEGEPGEGAIDEL